MKSDKHEFLWLDLETTGLDPHNDQILEWAIVLADDGAAGDLSPVHQFSGVVDPWNDADAMRDAIEGMHSIVQNMHARNGLFEAVAREGTPLAEAEDFLLSVCVELGAKPRQVVLAGSTVAFDLGFVRVHMPRFAEYLSHRTFDVSTLKQADVAWGGVPFAKAEAHRALPDVLESLAHAAAIKARRWAP